MKAVVITLLISISCYISAMQYVIAPFKSVYNTTCFLLGNQTLLEIEYDAFLKTVVVEHYANKEELTRWVSKRVKEYEHSRIDSSSFFLHYLVSLYLRYPDLEQRLKRKINSCVDDQIKTQQKRRL